MSSLRRARTPVAVQDYLNRLRWGAFAVALLRILIATAGTAVLVFSLLALVTAPALSTLAAGFAWLVVGAATLAAGFWAARDCFVLIRKPKCPAFR